MLTAFACSHGHLQRIGDAADDEELRRAVWIDLFEPTSDEIARVQQATGLVVPSEDNINEIESSSRLATRDGALYLSLPLVNMAEPAPRGYSAGFVLTPDRLLTVHFAPSLLFERFAERHLAGDAVGESGAHILVGLLEAIVDRQADVLEQVRTDLDTLSHSVFGMGPKAGGRKREDAMLRATLATLGRIGSVISYIRDTQVAVARIGPYVETAAADWLPADLHPRLATLRGDIASVSDFDTHLNDKLQFLLDATLGFINIAQNNVMKVLTVASVAGIPPVLVVGIYGMNFKGMPEYDWAWGYPYALSLIVVSTLVTLLVFWWRGWI
jgi:magnesium transporter